MKRITDHDLALIMVYRGLGFSQTEIGNRLAVSRGAVQYHLAKLRARALRYGNDEVFYATLSRGFAHAVEMGRTKEAFYIVALFS